MALWQVNANYLDNKERYNSVSNYSDVFMEGRSYSDIFGNRFVDENKKRKRIRRIVCIKHISGNRETRKIYRVWRSGNSLGVCINQILLDSQSAYYLIGNKNFGDYIDLHISPSNRFMFYWNHFDSATRISFKFGFVSFVLSVVSIFLSGISII